MKSWKNWPYWVRGGIVGSGVYLLFEIIFIIYKFTLEDTSGSWGISVLDLWSYFPMGVAYESFVADPFGLPSFLPLPVAIIVILNASAYFGIGALLFGIYGKIKNRRGRSLPNN